VDFWTRLDGVRARWDVLTHPFYVRWSAGELTRAELAAYAGEYRHAVVALADRAETVARMAGPDLREDLARHAGEERAHVALWDGFATAVGADLDVAPRPETRACASAWSTVGGDSVLAGLVGLYAIESAQPQISETKRAGLVERYGFEPDSAGTAYFDLHATLDVAHAASSRRLIEARVAAADADALVAEAESVLSANWGLLDGVDA
jgi:pyrroloquinoline-quinone synthase